MLYLIIGIPGSGKSTLASKIQNEILEKSGNLIKIYEADMYFTKNGKYEWNADNLGAAHFWCQKMTENELKLGNSVIVSNTSIRKRDRKIYIDLAKKYHHEIKVITCRGEFKNIHNVPQDKIAKMKERFQEFSEEELI